MNRRFLLTGPAGITRRPKAGRARGVGREDGAPTGKSRPRRELRDRAPSIDIQSINFEFGSSQIARSEYRKVRIIANALQRITRRRRGVRFLIEGHTDAVGSAASNQVLSEDRAEALKWALVEEFGIPERALETVGYGEEYLLVPTEREEWRNRRVTLRRIDEFLR